MSHTRIIQITDTHLFGHPTDQLMGVKTQFSLQAVLDLINKNWQSCQTILVTGDITQDGEKNAYHHLKNMLDSIQTPHFWICGNHDNHQLMAEVSPESMVKHIDLGDWQVIMLDSQTPGEVYGSLITEELELLERYLMAYPEKHSLIALHHHPCPTGSLWLDDIGLRNTDKFTQLIEKYNNARAIIHGHIHQNNKGHLAGIPVFSCPSTCVQFAENSEKFKLSPEMPGFRVLDLLDNGEIITNIIRLTDFPLTLDLESDGY